MNKKKIAVMMVILVLTCLVGGRIYYVNQNIDLPVRLEYKIGEVVPFEEDFNDDSNRIAKGYTIQVVESEMLTKEAFYEKYNPTENPEGELFKEYFYVIKAVFGNEDNTQGEECGIALDQVPLVGVNSWIMIDAHMFEVMNPSMPGLGFSLNPGTTKEVLLPYGIIPSSHGEYKYLKKHPPMLQITQYPHEKRIAIQ